MLLFLFCVVQGYCDRIVYCSTPDLAEWLVPEKVSISLDFTHPAVVRSGGATEAARSTAGAENSHLTKLVDNYQSVLEGRDTKFKT